MQKYRYSCRKIVNFAQFKNIKFYSMKQIKTVTDKVEYQFKEKGSIFIGQVSSIENNNQAIEMLNEIKKMYYDASHNCYAYKLIEDESFKYSDDGEPSGSAGIRILNAINHFKLSNVLIVSTRYFGGTKLGVGPLGKAYYNSAVGAIKNATIITKTNYSKILITFGFDFISDVHHFIKIYKVHDIKNLFNESPQIECLIKPEFINKLSRDLTAVSSGKIEIKILEKKFYL